MTQDPGYSHAALRHVSWAITQLDDAFTALLQHSGVLPQPPEFPTFSVIPDIAETDVIQQWLDIASHRAGVEIQPIQTTYADVLELICRSGPAMIYLPDKEDARLLIVLRGNRRQLTILTPEKAVRALSPHVIRTHLTAALESPLITPIQQLLTEAGVPQERQAKAKKSILNEQLSTAQITGCWMLRMSPGASFVQQIRQARLPRHLLLIILTIFVGQLFMIGGWWMMGRASLQGHFERAWLMAWAFMLFTAIPFQLLGSWAQNMLSLGLSALFRERLLFGILQLEPEEVRHHGVGQFLGIVMESESLESLALGVGFTAIISIFELVSAVVVLALGAGGVPHALLLLLWMGLTTFLCLKYYGHSSQWIKMYREMTNDLVERMVGHRTRLAQEDREHWHDEEDAILQKYVKLSERLDRFGLLIQSVIGRGWFIVGLSGIVGTFVMKPELTAPLAVSLGGILLASQALDHLTDGIMSVLSVIISWQQVGPLFQAATRERKGVSQASLLPVELEQHAAISSQPVLNSTNVSFRYIENRPLILQACNFRIQRDERILLEGPSGAGKSTLAALLTGLRQPESGALALWGVRQSVIGINEWRRRIVTAPQFHENHVLSETFAFNLLMGRRWPPEPEDLKEAEEICRELGLGELLDRMPAGFQQMIGESGWQLSHGEQSRLFIARALLQHADMMILDESFAALDPENLQRALQCVLNRAATVVVIAHP